MLSRQRAWGVPLTCFKRGTGENVEILRNEEVNARIVAAFREEGADAWFADGAKERFLGNVAGVNPDEWEKVDDILDVWFDSGSTHAFTLRDRPRPRCGPPLYLEGTDQHRGWFHSSMLQGCGTIGRAPYHAVLTHGFTLDEKGMKMSKSQMNAMSPEQGDRAIRRATSCGCGWRRRTTPSTADRARDPEGHGGQLSPPAQHAALHDRGLDGYTDAGGRAGRTRCRNWSA